MEHRYKGILAQPMKWDKTAFDRYAVPEDRAVANKHNFEAFMARVIALLDEFGATSAPNPWELVAMGLAERHVPAFQAPGRKRGTKPKRSPAKDLIAVVEMCKRLAQGQNVSEAAANIARKRKDLGSAGAIERSFARISKDPSHPARRLLRMLQEDE